MELSNKLQAQKFRIENFTYDLPENRIAKYPLTERDLSKLLVYNNGNILEDVYRNLDKYIAEQSIFVFNNTKVIQARLHFRNATGGRIEIFCLEPSGENPEPYSAMIKTGCVEWECLIGRADKWKEKTISIQTENFTLNAEVVKRSGNVSIIRFSWQPNNFSFAEILEQVGEMPIPPYLKRASEAIDVSRYQTVYAKHEGAVAAPTAGLHFSKELIKRAEIIGIRFAEVTLHTGLSTFRPIEVEDLSKHKMDAEYFKIDEDACRIINTAKENGRRVCSIGTTGMRAMESSVTAQRLLKPAEGWTNHFIHPPYNFNIADSLVTNFHLPKTSLLIMTCAFAGYELAMEAYKKAIKDKYRFFSYGDALLFI